MKVYEIIEENVTELFGPGKNWKWSYKGNRAAVAEFQVGEVPYLFDAFRNADGKWDVRFKQNTGEQDKSQKFGLTGTGNSVEVMSTVVDIMRSFLEKYQDKIQVLTFSAKEDSRQGLYARMVKRLLPTWTMAQKDEFFTLFAPKQGVTENWGIRKYAMPIVQHLAVGRDKFALLEDEFLGEIKMTGKNLRAEAAKTGALAGMEFEMIVPNTEVDVEPEYEPDYDQDQRARSFSNVRDFFHDGDYNGRRQVDDLMGELSNEYEDWMQEQTSKQWVQDGVDYIRDFVEVNDLFDRSEALGQARDEVVAANPDLSPESEDFQQLVNARINELQEQFVLKAFEDRGRIHDDAFGTFADEQREEYDERSFLDDRYQTMSDIQSNFDISWPHYYDINADQTGDMDGQQVADEFSSYMGKPVNYSSQYHGGRREPGTYVVEPDASLDGDRSGDGGLEFVSPPMPIDEMISDLNKVKKWAGKTGCYTNDSTGLHINISVPDYSIDKLDYVKLAILMGDEYILDLFGRSGNTYAKSAMGKIKSALKQNPEAAAQIMDLMKQGLDGAATKAIHTGITDKYTSINTKTGYIEFRSPGGDWLDSNFANIENTLLRFTVALGAAINPEAYRKEYLTKLYKLLSEGMSDKIDVNIIQLFSNYSAGELDKPALIRQVREKQLARNVAKGKDTGKMWWEVSNPANSFFSIEVVASSKEEAIDVALQPGNYPDWASARNTLQAKPLRPYQEKPKGPTLNGRPSNPTDNRSADFERRMQAGTAQRSSYELFLKSNGRVVTAPSGDPIVFQATDPDDAANKIARYVADFNLPGHPTNYDVRSVLQPAQQDASQGGTVDVAGEQPATASQAPLSWTGEWLILDPNDRVIHRFGGIGNVQADANRHARNWLQSNPRHMQAGVTVVPEMA